MSKYSKSKNVKLSLNFNSREFNCKGSGCCSETLISETLIHYLQLIREHFNKPVHINSGYRCGVHNKKVGGSTNSKHLYGMASDIVVEGVTPLEVAKYCESIGIKGIGLYDTFVHIDTRLNKYFWYSDKQITKTTFFESNKDLIIKWQRACRDDGFYLVVDGIFGSECEKVSKKAICKKLVMDYKNRNLTKFIQNCLGITADGKFGNDTKNAVINFQKLLGLKADGVVGYNTWKKLLNI